MRRVVTLLNQVAVSLENSADLQAQMDKAVQAAKQHQDDNLLLKQVSLDKSLKLCSFPFCPHCVRSTAAYCVPFIKHKFCGSYPLFLV